MVHFISSCFSFLRICNPAFCIPSTNGLSRRRIFLLLRSSNSPSLPNSPLPKFPSFPFPPFHLLLAVSLRSRAGYKSTLALAAAIAFCGLHVEKVIPHSAAPTSFFPPAMITLLLLSPFNYVTAKEGRKSFSQNDLGDGCKEEKRTFFPYCGKTKFTVDNFTLLLFSSFHQQKE